jgi:hypothetical protein
MMFRKLKQRDVWLHLEFTVAVTLVIAVILLGYIASKFVG